MGTLDDFLAFFGLATIARLEAAVSYANQKLELSQANYAELIRKLEAKAYPKTAAASKSKPLTGAQLRNMNDAQNAAFLEDRGEPSNSEVLKEN